MGGLTLNRYAIGRREKPRQEAEPPTACPSLARGLSENEQEGGAN